MRLELTARLYPLLCQCALAALILLRPALACDRDREGDRTTQPRTCPHSVTIFVPTPAIRLPCAAASGCGVPPGISESTLFRAIRSVMQCVRARACVCVCVYLYVQKTQRLTKHSRRTTGSFITYWLHLIYIQHSISLYTDISQHAWSARACGFCSLRRAVTTLMRPPPRRRMLGACEKVCIRNPKRRRKTLLIRFLLVSSLHIDIE